MSNLTQFEENAVKTFQEYLRIKSVQPNPDYDGAVTFLKAIAKGLDLPYQVVYVIPGHPVVIISVEGTDPSLPSIMLNSHIDVVPVFPEHWLHDPFAAVKTKDGKIYARGSQDMKCVGIQYIEAIRKMRSEGKTFLRTMHMTFVADEEVGGHKGMEPFIKTKEFKSLNVGFSFDEGLANPTEKFTVFYGERAPWWLWVKCSGEPGHGSRFVENTAAEKLQKVINRFMAFRAEQKAIMENDPEKRLGDVVTCNLTQVKGGVQTNVVPAELSVAFDIRVPPTIDLKKFQKQIYEWCNEAGEGVTCTWQQQFWNQNITSPTDDNIWWRTFVNACEKANITFEKTIFPAATDSRYIRETGIPALGFSPMNKTPILLHDHNEFLEEKIFLRGIDIYCTILPEFANLPAQ